MLNWLRAKFFPAEQLRLEAREWEIANAITRCFDEVDMTAQTFNMSGQPIKDANDCSVFYSKPELDKAIDKINLLVDELARNQRIVPNKKKGPINA